MIGEKPFLPDAVIFDMDGLMLDTEKPAMDAWIQAAEILGWRIAPEILCRTIGINEAGSQKILTDEYGPSFPYDEIRRKTGGLLLEKIEKEGIACRPGLSVLLDHLDHLNIPLAVATSTKKQSALLKLEKARIHKRFQAMAFGDEVFRGKPAPDIFLLAARRLGKAPQRCVGFEDSPAGLLGLAGAGIPSVFIKDMVEPSPEILAGVWRRCGDLAEAAALFG